MKVVGVAVAVVLAACSGSPATAPNPPSTAASTSSATSTTAIAQAPVTTASRPTPPAASSSTTSTVPPSSAPARATVPASTAGATPYGLPVLDAGRAGWSSTHSGYPATDIFVGCGATVISPVNGLLTEVRRINAYEPAVDNPATRGGRSVTMIGDDGVRYYFAHFERIVDGLEPGSKVTIGQPLGEMGDTGRASACHLHFAISPPCPGKEWSVRRGVVWPARYLDAWRSGTQLSPADEVARWNADHPRACAEAMADPNAPSA
jgi:murein DD-endopeptidase MepM/ murein hydrolase activator NlpD